MSLSQVHPILGDALASFVSVIPLAARTQRETYVRLLQQHDWSHEHSDDYSAWRKGRESLQALNLLRRDLDPDNAIWNAYAPPAYRYPPAAPKVAP